MRRLKMTMKATAALLSVGLTMTAASAKEASPACESPESIRFSVTPSASAEVMRHLYAGLVKRIEATTGRHVMVVQPTSYAAVIEGLLNGNLDVASMGPASYIEAHQGDDRISPFATIERRSGPFQAQGAHYQALLVVLTARALTSVETLRGTRLTLTDPSSTSGALLPRKRFAARYGASVDDFFRTVAYSGSHAKSLQMLLHGETDAIFIASNHLEDAVADGTLAASQVRVLWRSEAIPFDPFVYRGQLCAALRGQIREAFFGDAAPAELQEILQPLNANQFVPANDAAYDNLRRVLHGE